MSFSDKFNLSQKESIFLFKKHFSSVVYTGLKMENRNITFPETEAIESGVVRNGSVSISVTNYIPEIPDETVAKRNILDILTQNVSATEKALNLFLHLIYKQYFWDGNKRTALFASNFLLVQNCCGLLEIKDKYMKDFAVLLNEMFNTEIQEKIKVFLYTNCIEGITK